MTDGVVHYSTDGRRSTRYALSASFTHPFSWARFHDTEHLGIVMDRWMHGPI